MVWIGALAFCESSLLTATPYLFMSTVLVVDSTLEEKGEYATEIYRTNGRKKDYKKLWDEGAIWKRRIMKLLNTHMIKLVGHEGFYLVHMQGVADGKVHMYQFESI